MDAHGSDLRRGATAGGVFCRLSPEDRIGTCVEVVEVVEEVLEAGAGLEGLVAVELQVPVAPVQRPEAGGLGVVQACDREPGPLGAKVLAPGGSALADREVAGGDVALDADLVAQPLRDLGGAPPLRASDVELGEFAASHAGHGRHQAGGWLPEPQPARLEQPEGR